MLVQIHPNTMEYLLIYLGIPFCALITVSIFFLIETSEFFAKVFPSYIIFLVAIVNGNLFSITFGNWLLLDMPMIILSWFLCLATF